MEYGSIPFIIAIIYAIWISIFNECTVRLKAKHPQQQVGTPQIYDTQ